MIRTVHGIESFILDTEIVKDVKTITEEGSPTTVHLFVDFKGGWVLGRIWRQAMVRILGDCISWETNNPAYYTIVHDISEYKCYKK
jgi:hypothetical protein